MEVASALATPIWECCAKNITYLFTLPENLEAMEKSINRLKRIRGDVMERINREETNPAEPVKRTHDVSGWLQAVEASEQEVGKILEENEDLKIGGNNCCCWSPNTCWRAYKLNNLVSQNLSNVERLLSESDFQTVTNRCQLYSVQEMPTVRMEGMDSIFDEVLNLLVVDSVGVIGLYGMGGVGKTTLLKKISNSFAKGNRDFESVMWVKVPKDRNLKDIQNQIGAILGLSWEDKKGTEKRSLDIHQVLKNKRFLLCLDDVWERVDLERVGIPKIDIQEEETANSKVVFTTRSENVCGLMDADRRIKVDCLRWQEAWSLFREKVKQDALNCHPDVAELAQKVAKECLGLPLALVTIGRTMASKTTLQQWHHALNILRGSPAKFPGMANKVLPKLKFSYDNLENEKLKMCFLYCSLYPEGYTINTEELIELWIEEGFLDEVCDLNGAHEVIGSLKSACLLEGCFGMENQVKMHDVVRDMAIWVASDLEEEKKYLYLTLQTRGTVTFDGDEKIQRISLIENKAIKRLSGAPICPYLSTLLLMNSKVSTISDDFFQSMPKLRVLNMSNSDIKNLPTSVTSLTELQYLNLSATLSSSGITPGTLASLKSLRVLNLFRSRLCDWEAEDEPSIRELESLNYLNYLGITIENGVALQRLANSRKLQLCTKLLHIRECRGITSLSLSPSSPSSPMLVSLADMGALKTLFLQTCDELEEVQIISWTGGKGKVTLFTTLEELEILSMQKLKIIWNITPRHDFSFENLKYVTISKCPKLKDVTWLICAPSLEKLDLYKLDGLEEIISIGCVANEKIVNTFSKLKCLCLERIRLLNWICHCNVKFQHLEVITVRKCPNLKKLPFATNSVIPNTLTKIQGDIMWWESLQWDDEDVKYNLAHFLDSQLSY